MKRRFVLRFSLVIAVMMLCMTSLAFSAISHDTTELNEEIVLDGTIILRRADIGTINANNVNLRTGPGTNYPSIAQLSKGTEVEIQWNKSNSTWYSVMVLSSGQMGYVSSQYVDINS